MRNNQDMKMIATIFVITAGCCWGVIGYFSRALSSLALNSIQITFLRSSVTALMLLIILALVDYKKLRIVLKDLWLFLGTGVLSIAFFNICYFSSIEANTLSLASTLLYTAPSFVVIMSSIVFKERITKQKRIAIVMSFVGLLFAVGIFDETVKTSVYGLLVGLGSGLGYALYSIFGRLALKKYDSLTVTFYTFLITTMALIPISEPVLTYQTILSHGESIKFVLALGFVSTLLPFLLYTKGLQHLEVGKASILTFVEPVVATLMGILVFGEKLTIYSAIGIFLIIISIVILNIKSRVRTQYEIS